MSKSAQKIRHNRTTKKSILLLLLSCLLLLLLPSPASSSSFSSCLAEEQERIFNSIPSCQTRPTLVDLRDMFSNHSNVMQVVPDHVSVDRCGGSCYAPSHSCNPTVRSINKVEVMLVMSKWPHGEHETLCTEVEVEAHHECMCGCQVQPDHCLPELQYYHQPSCSCICTNTEERALCLLQEKVWDPQTCQCHCPSHSWQHCSTGYMFDYVSSCSCVQINSLASKSVIAAIILLSASITVSLAGGYLMFTFKRGPFKQTTHNNEHHNPERRTNFMSQISKVEFDLMNQKAKLDKDKLLTVYEFDAKRSSLESQDTMEETI